MNLLIIIATYNERENLPRLVSELESVLPNADLLVIDDQSPDGTGNWFAEWATTHPSSHLIQREAKLGLGTAAATGFRWGLEREYDAFATLDADLSHAPADLARLVQTLVENPATDVVIGSRYVPGGKIVGWPWRRHWISRTTNWLARRRLGLGTRDNTGALRVYRRSALARLDLDSLASEGYAYLPELLWRLERTGARFCEVPITFHDRTEGQSKADWRVGWEMLGKLASLPQIGNSGPGSRGHRD